MKKKDLHYLVTSAEFLDSSICPLCGLPLFGLTSRVSTVTFLLVAQSWSTGSYLIEYTVVDSQVFLSGGDTHCLAAEDKEMVVLSRGVLYVGTPFIARGPPYFLITPLLRTQP